MGGGGQQQQPAKERKEVLIDGMLYDVTSFRHPGGSIIKFLTNHGDATDAFHQFHLRSERAQKLLKVLPKRPAPKDVIAERGGNGQEGLAKAFAKLHSDLKAEGYFDPSMAEVAYRTLELVAIHALGAYFLMTATNVFSVIAGILCLAMGQGRCGWLMHEGGHYSMTGNVAIDKAFQIVLYGVGCGMSAGWWRSQHNRHHATPQKLQHDVDLETLPLVAFNTRIAERTKSPAVRAWLSMQHILFIPVSCLLVALGWQLFLHPRYMLRTKKKFEFMTLFVRYYLLFGVVLQGYTWPAAIAIYLLYNGLSASYIFTNFALSHTHLPVTNPDEYLHWVEYASKHTTNITSSALCDWWMAYLNYQIEHHLFPSMPQFRHPKIAGRVRKLFEDHGLVYDVRDYFACLDDTLSNLARVGNPDKAK
ncbi:delta-5 desaturase [Salpingoeca rosetta]|uniref:Delta-5 desaturase n=1 Tax=Salpingoeca rosetta (strain ATCC 50818 / BSB-021) TaxID=946362 RepID=F2UAM2_SALR5|nr:delta-5 desaturase [Salpingoeca rosetta]EGD73438.1 delta-5 desaturase [Salpingoeca rosetta]|eukprot:XP_004993720.1 delta-5 desaturase [Salpingoeca rosetta]